MYAMLCTRLDVSYALSITSRYQANPGDKHWMVINNILKYLKRTKNLFLIFDGGSKLKVKRYIDLDFISDVDDRKSTSRCIFLYNGGSVSQESFKQSVIVD